MLAAIIVVLIVVADQGSKLLVSANMELFETRAFIPGFIRLYYVENTGASFGILKDARWVFMVLSTAAIIAVIIFMLRYKKRHTLLTVGLSFVLGGGIGNMIDRFARGAVIDFFDFEFVSFAIFNVADMFITFGAAIMIIYLIFFETRLKNTAANEENREELLTDEVDRS